MQYLFRYGTLHTDHTVLIENAVAILPIESKILIHDMAELNRVAAKLKPVSALRSTVQLAQDGGWQRATRRPKQSPRAEPC